MKSVYSEEYYAHIYEEAYSKAVAQGEDKRVARAMAKAEENARRRDCRSRRKAQTITAIDAPLKDLYVLDCSGENSQGYSIPVVMAQLDTLEKYLHALGRSQQRSLLELYGSRYIEKGEHRKGLALQELIEAGLVYKEGKQTLLTRKGTVLAGYLDTYYTLVMQYLFYKFELDEKQFWDDTFELALAMPVEMAMEMVRKAAVDFHEATPEYCAAR